MRFKYLKTLSLLMAVLAVGCVMQPLRNLDGIQIPQRADGSTLTLDQVQQAIVQGAHEKQWITDVVGPGHIVAKHSQMSSDGVIGATVDVTFTTQSYSIDYKDSQGLSYDPKRNRIHMHYRLWQSNLSESIYGVLQGMLQNPAP